MKICIIAEGCYPYSVGGVSSWIHNLIQAFPNLEFVLLTILPDRARSGQFVYDLPENVSEVYETYLSDQDWSKRRGKRRRISRKEQLALRNLIMNQEVEWDIIFDMFHKSDISVNDLLMGPDFLYAAQDSYDLRYNQLPFADYLWTVRSIYLPLFLVMKTNIPQADVYHCVSTGYAGILGCMGQYFHESRLLVSEHGIYTREREEEIIRAKWVQGIYKDIWIEQFRKMSKLTYDRADRVTSLYQYACRLQQELGCPPEKCVVIPNGVRVENYEGLPGKAEEDEGRINIGAVMRVTPIKDVKTLIQSFGYARSEEPRLRLWIMGPWEEDENYAQECFDMVEELHIPDVIFTGSIDVHEYLGRMDMTILTSISEGQPLTILESFAAGKPVIATNVGNCRGMILGEDEDQPESAGAVTHIMNAEELTQAMLNLARNEGLRTEMGEVGYRRVREKYQFDQMIGQYRELYRTFADQLELEWPEEEN